MRKREWPPKATREGRVLYQETMSVINGPESEHPLCVDKELEHFLDHHDQYNQAEKQYVEAHCRGCQRCAEVKEKIERNEFMESWKKEGKEAEL